MKLVRFLEGKMNVSLFIPTIFLMLKDDKTFAAKKTPADVMCQNRVLR